MFNESCITIEQHWKFSEKYHSHIAITIFTLPYNLAMLEPSLTIIMAVSQYDVIPPPPHAHTLTCKVSQIKET